MIIIVMIIVAFYFYKKNAGSENTVETMNKQQIELNHGVGKGEHVQKSNHGVNMSRINSDEGMSTNTEGDYGINQTVMMHHMSSQINDNMGQNKLSFSTVGGDDIVAEALNMAMNHSKHDQDMDIVASINNETGMRQPGTIGSENEVIEYNEEKEKDYDIINEVNMNTPGYQDQNTARDDDVMQDININHANPFGITAGQHPTKSEKHVQVDYVPQPVPVPPPPPIPDNQDSEDSLDKMQFQFLSDEINEQEDNQEIINGSTTTKGGI